VRNRAASILVSDAKSKAIPSGVFPAGRGDGGYHSEYSIAVYRGRVNSSVHHPDASPGLGLGTLRLGQFRLCDDVSSAREFDLVSAFGYALGYVGGGLLFAVNVLMVKNPDWFGLAGPGEAVRASFLSVSLWWALFTVPIVFIGRAARRARRA
jgi:hypothetical protein